LGANTGYGGPSGPRLAPSRCCDNFLYRLQGHAFGAPARPALPGSDVGTRSHRGDRGTGEKMWPRAGRGVGLLADSRRRPAAPFRAESPTGAPPPPRRCPALAGRRFSPLRAHDDRARTNWPGRPPRAGHPLAGQDRGKTSAAIRRTDLTRLSRPPGLSTCRLTVDQRSGTPGRRREPSNQASNYRRHQRGTPADTDRRCFPVQKRSSPVVRIGSWFGYEEVADAAGSGCIRCVCTHAAE